MIRGLLPIKPNQPRLQNTHLNRFTIWNCQILKVNAAGWHWWNIGVHCYLTKSWPLLIGSGRSGMIRGLLPIKPNQPRLQNTHLNRFTIWNCQILKVNAAGWHWWNIGVHCYLTKSWPLLIGSGRSGMIRGLLPIKPNQPRLQNTHLNRFTIWNCQILKVNAAGWHWLNIGVHCYLTKSWPLLILSGRSGMIRGLGPIDPH
jgi:hypothetical protein